MDIVTDYLNSALFEFRRYKSYGDRTFSQLTEQELHWRLSPNDNSIAIIIQHLAGNMLSRWTNLLTEDGEKKWRERDEEFETGQQSKAALIALWNTGWECLFEALEGLDASNINNKINIRGEAHAIPAAINRQLAHYASHVGQIVFIGKAIKGQDWQTLTIAKGKSKMFNKKMFGKNS